MLQLQGLFVAANGNDLSPGTQEQPFATLAQARDAVRSLPELPANGITVWIRAGTYELSTALELDHRDSGTIHRPITYRSYPGETVTISGGVELSPDGWESTTHNGNEVYKKNVGSLRFTSLFVDDRMATRSREPDPPDDGFFFLIESVDPETSLEAFRFSSGDINPSWLNLRDVEIISYRKWLQSRIRIDRVEPNKVFFQESLAPGRGYDWDYQADTGRFYVENVFEGLDEPGEWYLNNDTGDLYYRPRDGETIGSSVFVAPVLEQVLRLNGTENVLFRDLEFAHTAWKLPGGGYPGGFGAFAVDSAIVLQNTVRCGFEDNVFKHLGYHAIGNRRSSSDRHLHIVGNEIRDIGASGILLRGHPSTALEASIIADNAVHDVGQVYKEAMGIRVTGIAVSISHNVLFNIPYVGISSVTERYREGLRWEPNTIEHNEIYNVMQELNDGGGIYCSGQQPGTVIQNNEIHDIVATNMHLKKGDGTLQGLYLDEGAKGFTLTSNVVYRTDDGMLLHRSPNNEIVNNIFVGGITREVTFSGYGQRDQPRDMEQPANRFTRNIIFGTKEARLFTAATKDNDQVPIGTSDFNVLFTTTPGAHWNLEGWRTTHGFEANSLEQDPLFVDYDNDDFTLMAESRAFGLGFVQIDLSRVGPRAECSNHNPCPPAELCAYGRCMARNRCGNLVMEAGEECDRDDLGGIGCEALGFDFGAVSCSHDCASIITDACWHLSEVPADYVSYWRLDGDTNDENGLNHGTVHGGADFASDPARGQVASFDGDNDYISVPHSSSLDIDDNITISYWVNAVPTPINSDFILAKGSLCYDPSHQGYDSYIGSDGTLYTRMCNGSGSERATVTLGNPAGGWQHIVQVYDGAEYSAFLNGEEKGRHPFTGSVSHPTELRLCYSSTYCIDGAVDDLMIFNRALSGREIAALHYVQR